jgi:hypothetical protein
MQSTEKVSDKQIRPDGIEMTSEAERVNEAQTMDDSAIVPILKKRDSNKQQPQEKKNVFFIVSSPSTDNQTEKGDAIDEESVPRGDFSEENDRLKLPSTLDLDHQNTNDVLKVGSPKSC